MQEESLVKNVKQFVSEFENSRIDKNSQKDGQQKILKSEKVAALRESLEKHMHQEFVPQRSIPPLGRSLAEVKNELCKSMEALQSVKPSLSSLSNLQKVKRNSKLARYNSTDVLSQCKDDATKRFYPVPAPRRCSLIKIGKTSRRYKSNSDLSSTSEASTSTSLHQDCRNGSEEHLEDILEVSVLSSKLGASESHLKSSEYLEENVFDDQLPNNLSITSTKVSELNYSESFNINSSVIGCESVENSSSRNVIDKDTNNGVKYCCRLNISDWNNIVSCLPSVDEELFVANISTLGLETFSQKCSQSFCLSCNFDLILDVLTFESIQSLEDPSLVTQKDHIPNIDKEKLISLGRKFEMSLTALLKDINEQLSCSTNVEKVLMEVFDGQMIQKLKAKFESILKELEISINLLFLLNRMLQLCESSSKKNSFLHKLVDAKEIKKALDLNCQRHFTKLKSSLSSENFQKCLEILTSKLSLCLKKECISFKLARLSSILKTLEETKHLLDVV